MDRYAQVALLKLDYDEAYARYTALRKAHPDAPHGYLGQVDVLLKQRLVDEAEEVLAEGIARFPEHPLLRQRYGLAAMRRWDFDEAMSRFEELVRLHPDNATGYIGKANLLIHLNKLREAESHIAWSIHRFQQNLVLREMHTLVSFRRVRYDEAHSRYESLMALYPRDSSGYIGLIRVLVRKKMFDEVHGMLLRAMTTCRF
ncbi:MAG: tetratricopeptide repeat protein, partial [Desulfovibrionaceae bacterium]|nr:tetratricopeptide repeat protein [Desulfovibrionaceae bacterium]